MHLLWNKKTLLCIKLILAGALLWFLMHTAQIKVELLFSFIKKPALTLSVFVIFLMMMLLSARRWQYLNGAQGIHIGFVNTLLPTYIGAAFNTVLPGAVGGDLVRWHYLFKRVPHKKSVMLFSIFFDRLLGFIGLFMLLTGVFLARLQEIQRLPQLYYTLTIFTCICIGLIVLILVFLLFADKLDFSRWFPQTLREKTYIQAFVSFADSLKSYRDAKSAIIKCLALSAFLHFLIASTLVLIALIIELPPLKLSDYILAIGVAQVVNLIPITPGGIGLGEIAFANVLLILNAPIQAAFATVLLSYRLISTISFLPGVLMYLSSLLFFNKTTREV